MNEYYDAGNDESKTNALLPKLRTAYDDGEKLNQRRRLHVRPHRRDKPDWTCMGAFGVKWFLSVSPGRSHAAGRSPGAPRDRARQLPGACLPISILRGCQASCRARRGIRPVDRSASLLRLPNAEDVAGDAAPAPRAVSRSAGGAWRGVALAARQRSAVPRGCDVWEY